jgi:hypothetical protein
MPLIECNMTKLLPLKKRHISDPDLFGRIRIRTLQSDPEPNPCLQKWSYLKVFDEKRRHNSGSGHFEKSDPDPVENREHQPL